LAVECATYSEEVIQGEGIKIALSSDVDQSEQILECLPHSNQSNAVNIFKIHMGRQ